MFFKIQGAIENIETIPRGAGVKSRSRLKKNYGTSRWLKKKEQALVVLFGGLKRRAEVHWYEAHGIGRKEFTIKRFLD